MVAFIGNTLRRKVSGENFDESIASRQNLSDFSPIKILRYTVQGAGLLCSNLISYMAMLLRASRASLASWL